MNTRELIWNINETHQRMLALSDTKGQEYAGSEDRLANFKRGAQSVGLPPTTILNVYASKHWDSIQSFIRGQVSGEERELSEPIEGRIDDLILYLILLKCLIREVSGPRMGVDEPEAPTVDAGKSLTRWQSEIAKWADKVFPDRTTKGSLAKLVMEEIPEFIQSGCKDPLEYADLLIMIMDIAEQQGISCEEALIRKMLINFGRTWGRDPETGYYRHEGDND